MRRWSLALAVIFGTSGFALSQAGTVATLCRQDEQVLFHCPVQGGRKLVSLCGSSHLTATEGYVQYRFGPAREIELEFPRQRDDSQKQFRYAHYLRYQVDRSEVSFRRDGHTYTLFDGYEGDTKPSRRLSGVRVDTPEAKKKSVTLSCSKPATSKLPTLDTIVPCDKDNPLNMGNCP